MLGHLVIVEDHGLIAHTLAAALELRGASVMVIDPTTERGDLVAAVVAAEPDLVLLDLDLGPGGDGLALLPDLTAEAPVVVLTGVTDPVRLARCVVAGAAGLLSKSSSFDEMTALVERALAGRTLLARHERDEHLALLRKHEADRRRRLSAFEQLTPREQEILGEIVRGATVEAIARASVTSIATVRTHVRAILRKLDVSSQVAAIARARDAGWDPPQEG